MSESLSKTVAYAGFYYGGIRPKGRAAEARRAQSGRGVFGEKVASPLSII